MRKAVFILMLILPGCAATPEMHAHYAERCVALGMQPTDACKYQLYQQDRAARMSGYSAWKLMQAK